MAFIHCHHCNWGQDDFWSESYNPIKGLRYLEELLFVKDLDAEYLPEDGEFESMTYREYILKELKNSMSRINNMRFRTHEEWGDSKCLRCGRTLCID